METTFTYLSIYMGQKLHFLIRDSIVFYTNDKEKRNKNQSISDLTSEN